MRSRCGIRPIYATIRCTGVTSMAGWHRLAFVYDLLNLQRPWCWSIKVVCDTCRKTLTDLKLDERDAEAFLRKKALR
jgi:hypothetical protein